MSLKNWYVFGMYLGPLELLAALGFCRGRALERFRDVLDGLGGVKNASSSGLAMSSTLLAADLACISLDVGCLLWCFHVLLWDTSF